MSQNFVNGTPVDDRARILRITQAGRSLLLPVNRIHVLTSMAYYMLQC